MATIDKQTFAKAIHDLCVAAGVNCGHRAGEAATPSVKRVVATGRRRRNLTLAEAERLARDGR
jgi:hypothetical protein